MRLPPLSDLIQYKNERLIHYFCHHNPAVSKQEGKQLLRDLLAWMWLSAYRQTKQRATYFFGPLLKLDIFWHSFILHTRDYLSFCQHYFGEYIHHNVEAPGFEHQLTPEELSDFLNDCFEYLGEEWVNRYFKCP